MFKINKDECIECGFCKRICPKGAIELHSSYGYEIDLNCISCSLCSKNCPVNAISKIELT
ncbi:MAG: hypothetical protein B6227_04605 [Fusobacteriia bacterium 4572_74]|nr:MAG: hypothetical protein B6227_04605 [Fusobacteriia bacterium 4572_74]